MCTRIVMLGGGGEEEMTWSVHHRQNFNYYQLKHQKLRNTIGIISLYHQLNLQQVNPRPTFIILCQQ